ncbi:MAG: late competence development ComFB family protein [Bacillota bacterium]
MIYNYTEDAVRRMLSEVLKDYLKTHPQTCTCDSCRDDIMALALNQLPPHYVASEQGTIFTSVSFEQIGGKAQVVAAITQAIKQVAKNPRHG